MHEEQLFSYQRLTYFQKFLRSVVGWALVVMSWIKTESFAGFESEQTDELASDKMGSTPSTQSDIPPSMRGRFVQQTSDLLTLSHARVHDENETSSENDNTIDDEQSVKDTLHRSPMRGVHFKSSTLPRNREVSIFPQKGKYRFHRTSLSSDTESPSKINCDKLHQSDSPGTLAVLPRVVMILDD